MAELADVPVPNLKPRKHVRFALPSLPLPELTLTFQADCTRRLLREPCSTPSFSTPTTPVILPAARPPPPIASCAAQP